MQRLYILLIILSTVSANAQIIQFQDISFKSRLLAADTTRSIAHDINGNNMKIDANNNGEIEIAEALVVYKLSPSGSAFPVYNVVGIEYFTNLTHLDFLNPFGDIETMNLTALVNLEWLGCNNTTIRHIDLSDLIHLKSLHVSNSNVETLNVTGATGIEILSCGNNQLSSLNLSDQVNLKFLDCTQNDLTALDLNGLNKLKVVRCQGNNISNLNLTGAAELLALHCNSNNLQNLDVSHLQKLQFLNCQSNHLSELVVHGLPELTHLDCLANNLTALNLSELPNLEILYCAGNNLSQLDVDQLYSLKEFSCGLNQLTFLDVSGLSQLYKFDCGPNNLSAIHMKGIAFNGGENDWLYFANNPNSEYVCVDESKIELVRGLAESYQYDNLQINSSCTLGINGNDNIETLVVYPNPVNDILNFASDKNRKVRSIAIYNVLGQKIITKDNKAIESVDVSALSSGNYFIKINSDKGSTNAKFAKK